MTARVQTTGAGRPDTILPPPAVFAATYAVTAVAWTLAGLLWSSGNRPFAVSLFALGLSLGPCLTAYATAPCHGCGACRRVCPMDVDVAALALAGRRIGPGDCVLCQRCVHACPTGVLHLEFGPARSPRAVEPLLGGRT